MRGIQGALIVSSTLQILVAFSGLWRNVASLVVIFGMGLVTNLSPCTLSVLPLTLGYIVAFALRLATTLAILGIAASFVRKAYGEIGQGLPLAASGTAVVMGLNLLEIVVRVTLVGSRIWIR